MSAARQAAQLQPPDLDVATRAGKSLLTCFDLDWLETIYKINGIPEAKVRLVISDSTKWKADVHGAQFQACRPGTEITIRSRQDRTVLFSGIVVTQECELTAERSSITLILKHPLYKLVTSLRSQLFEQKTDRDIIGTLLAAHGIRLNLTQGLAVRHAQMLQFSCSDWQFARSRLLANGVWLAPGPARLDILKPALAAAPAHVLSADIASFTQEVPIAEASWRFSNAEQPARLEVSSWRRETQALGNSVARPMTLGRGGLDPVRLAPLSKATWSLSHSYSLAPDEQAALADASLLSRQLDGIQASFRVWGSFAYEVGQTLQLSGYGAQMDGMGLITEVRQKITKSAWFTRIFLGGDGWDDIDTAVVPPIAGLHVGVVDRHEDDSTGLNRIRVRIPVLNLPRGQPVWARFGMPYASQGAGLCLYPETGDEVVLGFFEGDPRYPVILGSMHNPRTKAPYGPSAGNDKKGLVLSRQGVVQQFLFEQERAALNIASGEIVAEADRRIALAAGKDVAITGAASVAIKGAKIDLDN